MRHTLRSFIVGAIVALVLAWTVPLLAQGVRLMSGATSDLASVNAFKAIEFVMGKSTRPTYIATVSAQVTTAAIVLSIESSASLGFRLAQWCFGVSNATAAAGVTVTLQRRTTASIGGTVVTAENTGTGGVAKMDPADGNFAGTVRLGGTLGTIGAVLDNVSFTIGELGAGTADSPGQRPFCKQYGLAGEKLPTVNSGTGNGVTITVGSQGAGALAFGSISATIIEN